MTPPVKRAIFAAVAVLWLLLDQATKMALEPAGAGSVIYESQLGFIDIILAHNTGGAWSLFAGFPSALGVVSVIVCVAIVVYLLTYAKNASLLTYVSLALVFAGGIGNAIDRFWHGYVVDFIATAFMDFPVFNIADIGVTVGVVLFILSLLLEGRRADDGAADQLRSHS